MSNNKLSWRINEQIFARELRVIGADAKQIGILSKAEAIKLAKESGMDLVEIAPSAKPPVAKIIEFSKFRYQEEKKLKAESKKTKGGELKEIRFSPFIAENDYQTRLERIIEFLNDRNKVRVVVVFKGRQLGSKQFGYDVFHKLLADLGETVKVDMEPKFLGRRLNMVISPTNKSKKAKEQASKSPEELKIKNL